MAAKIQFPFIFQPLKMTKVTDKEKSSALQRTFIYIMHGTLLLCLTFDSILGLIRLSQI